MKRLWSCLHRAVLVIRTDLAEANGRPHSDSAKQRDVCVLDFGVERDGFGQGGQAFRAAGSRTNSASTWVGRPVASNYYSHPNSSPVYCCTSATINGRDYKSLSILSSAGHDRWRPRPARSAGSPGVRTSNRGPSWHTVENSWNWRKAGSLESSSENDPELRNRPSVSK